MLLGAGIGNVAPFRDPGQWNVHRARIGSSGCSGDARALQLAGLNLMEARGGNAPRPASLIRCVLQSPNPPQILFPHLL